MNRYIISFLLLIMFLVPNFAQDGRGLSPTPVYRLQVGGGIAEQWNPTQEIGIISDLGYVMSGSFFIRDEYGFNYKAFTSFGTKQMPLHTHKEWGTIRIHVGLPYFNLRLDDSFNVQGYNTPIPMYIYYDYQNKLTILTQWDTYTDGIFPSLKVYFNILSLFKKH